MTHKELEHFKVEEMQGGNQEILRDFWMRLGGCAAVTACDVSIFCDLNKGTGLYPFDLKAITKASYEKFAMIMKPYISPRAHGVNKLCLFTEGFEQFLQDVSCSKIRIIEFDGHKNSSDAIAAVKEQIDKNMPIAFLNLTHQDPALKDFYWHWFLLTGYEDCGEVAFSQKILKEVSSETKASHEPTFDHVGASLSPDCQNVSGDFKVRVTSYGEHVWMDFRKLWDSGSEEKGGMIFFDVNELDGSEPGNAPACLARNGFLKKSPTIKLHKFLRLQWMFNRAKRFIIEGFTKR